MLHLRVLKKKFIDLVFEELLLKRGDEIFLPERSEGKKPLKKSYGFFVEELFQNKILVQEE